MSHENTEPHDRIQATMALEVSLLVSLCSPSPNICSLATKCLGLMCIEAKMIDEELESQHSVMSFSHNMEIYEDLSFEEPHVQGLRKQAFVGRKAQQKRVRKYLRMINLPTPGVLNAWEEVWKRWRVLTQVVSRFGMDTLRDLNDIVSSNPAAAKKIGGLVKHDKVKTTSIRAIPVPVARIETDDEKQTEWQNYTGFLAALGGSRLIAEMEDDFVDDKRSKSNDRLASPSQSNFIATKFVTEMVELLTSDSVFVREAVKDALGGDLSPSLYPVLFRNLEITISHLFNPNGEIYSDSNNSLLVEQSVLILKMVLDRLVDPSDCLLNIDFSTLVLKLASYINKLPRGNYTTLRIMILMCHLTEVLMLKKEQVIIRDDVRVRNKLLEIMVEWTSDFNTVCNWMYIFENM
jgi:neurofibromin 1